MAPAKRHVSGYELVEGFYRNLRTGIPAAVILQRAQVALLRRARTSHPFYWASLQLHGAWR